MGEDLNPKFWYLNEQGKITKYIYCKLCHSGPFKESEKRVNFDFYGQGNRDPYCITCASALKFLQSSPSPNLKKPEVLNRAQNQVIKSPFETEAKEEPPESDIPELD